MNDRYTNHLHAFASLRWYDETIKFVFSFVTKTSELLLAAGIIMSTANFLTDGDVMNHNKGLSDAWSWVQAFAIDSSLGIVFMNAFQAVRERDKVKAVIFFTLTALLATVAGLITHFDALAHAAGLSVTDKGVSGILPLWVMTALRSIAVIGFLLASRLKQVSFSALKKEWMQEQEVVQMLPNSALIQQIDYTALTTALIGAMQQVGTPGHVNVVEQEASALPLSKTEDLQDKPLEVRLTRAYEALQRERVSEPNNKPISARELAKRANVRRSTCSEWLQNNENAKTEVCLQEEGHEMIANTLQADTPP